MNDCLLTIVYHPRYNEWDIKPHIRLIRRKRGQQGPSMALQKLRQLIRLHKIRQNPVKGIFDAFHQISERVPLNGKF